RPDQPPTPTARLRNPGILEVAHGGFVDDAPSGPSASGDANRRLLAADGDRGAASIGNPGGRFRPKSDARQSGPPAPPGMLDRFPGAGLVLGRASRKSLLDDDPGRRPGAVGVGKDALERR